MKLLCWGDIHANFSYPDYMDFLTRTMNYLVDVVKDVQPDRLICMGDVLDSFGAVDLKTALWAKEAIDNLAEAVRLNGGTFVLISGNHDVADADALLSSLYLIEMPHTIVFVKDPEEMDGICYAPFGAVAEKVIEILSRGTAKTLVSHFDWIGARLTPSFVSDKGWDVQTFARMFPGVRVLNGHYHNPSQMGPVTFVGAPLFRNFADTPGPTPRGFYLYDTATGQGSMIQNPYTYRLVTIEADTTEKLQAAFGALKEPKQVKARIYVPAALLAEAEALRESFLWCSIIGTDTYRSVVPEGQGISLTAVGKDVVEAAVATAPDGFDRAKLRAMGLKAFGV